jgi:cold shock CspA family protein/tetratricopeptide (TPR) repeat protein
MYYVVDPGISDVEQRYWASHRITAIRMTFEDFLQKLDRDISTTSRSLPKSIGGGETSLRSFYKVRNAPETKALLFSLSDDFEHVRPGMGIIAGDPKEFYRGNAPGWGPIEQNLDVSRAITDALVVDAILSSEDERSGPVELYAVKGPAGNGKTIVLKRAAWMAAHDYNKLVLFMRPGGTIRGDVIEEIHQYTSERIFLFIDKAAFYVDEIQKVIELAKAHKIRLTVIVAERDAEWNVRCEALDGYGVREYPVRYLSEIEVRALLEKLEKHNSLGLLAELKNFEDRVQKLMGGAQRQLLVALHEATLGKAFEDIVFEEYHRILPNEAQSLYLDICTLNRLGVSVRAGLISRVSGITFAEFEGSLFKPLEHIVRAYSDKYIGDIVYLARHQHVAQMVFDRVLSEPERRYDQIIRIMGGMNLDYSSDRTAFSQLVRGHWVSEALRSRELGRAFFEVAAKIAPQEAFLFQQRGVYEMEDGGDLTLADSHLTQAHDLEPYNKSIQHSLAVLNRKKAHQTTDVLLRQRFRDRARALLGPLLGQGAESSHGYHTAAQIALDDLRDVLGRIEAEEPQQMTERRIVDLARDFERFIQEGLQRFPLNEHLLALEAEYRKIVDQNGPAEMALRKAFTANPRQDWIAIRLAKTLQQSGKADEAKDVLVKCLQENPTSKRIHFELANLYMDHPTTENRALIFDHLRRSFTAGDQNYEAQFWYAREAFMTGDFGTAKQIFQSLRTARIPSEYKNRIRGVLSDEAGRARVFVGEVFTVEDAYMFVKCPDFQENIFVHRSRTSADGWEQYKRGTKVALSVGFTMRGPTAASVRLLS